MSGISNPHSTKKFQVTVGLAEITVTCASERDAVRLARARLGQEMPQMRSIIRGIKDKEFRVDTIG
jgi:hypothetical protein